MADFVSPWQGFAGVPEIGSQTFRQNLNITVLNLTHQDCLPQKTATLVGRDGRSTGVAVGYGPRNIAFLCYVGYAILPCAKLDDLPEIFALCRGKVRNPATLVAEVAQFNSCRLTDFDTPGQFLTLGDKTTLFLAVLLKKVRDL